MNRATAPGILYQETQRLRSRLFWASLLLPMILFDAAALAALYAVTVRGVQLTLFGGPAIPPVAVIIFCVTGLLISAGSILYHARVRLHLQVTGDALYLRYAPLHRRVRQVDLHGVVDVCATPFRPFRQYGGYGIRRQRLATSYTVSGTVGVRIAYGNGCHVLLSSGDPEALARAVRRAAGLADPPAA